MWRWHQVGMVLFSASAALLFYVYLGYPILLVLISVFSRKLRAELGYEPSLSVLIAAYNERANIVKKVQDTLALDYPPDKIEVVVASDGSTDGTDELVKSLADPRVRLVRTSRRGGKTNAQNEAVLCCEGEVIVFSDATTAYHPHALRYLATNYQDFKVGAVSGRYQYFDLGGTSPTGLGSIAFWNYENIIKRLQSRINTITGCCGCIYSVRRAAYTTLQPDIISDLVQPLCAIGKGYKVVFEDRALAYEETTQSTQQEFAMRVRVVTRAMRGLFSVRDLLKPWKHPWISFQLFSHKILRWMVPFLLFALFAGNCLLLDRPWLRAPFILQGCFYVVALLSLIVPIQRWSRLLAIPLYFCTLNAAALVSIWELLYGRKYVVWETVRT